jgi:predicted membrane protein
MDDFNNRNLRDRSFRGCNLQKANFSGCDLRGCDFSNAQLQGANFQNIKAGISLTKSVASIVVVAIALYISFPAYSQMIFAVVGLTPADPAWSYTYPLHISLGVAAWATVAIAISPRHSPQNAIASILSAAGSGALLGFFYLGSSLGNNATMAVTGAIFGALLGAILGWWQKKGWLMVAIAALGTIASYGFTFLLVATSIYLSSDRVLWGIFWTVLALVSFAATIIALQLTIQQIATRSTTSFRSSDLTDAIFDGAQLGSSDFTKAIGFQYDNHFRDSKKQ